MRKILILLTMAMLWGCTSTYDDSKNGQTIKSAEYKVEHWKENADNDGYTLNLRYIVTGSVGEETNESEMDYTGFTVIPFSQQIIKADGSTTVKIYYKRKIVNLTFDYNDGTNKIVLSGKYGASHPTIPNPTRFGYVFAEWIPSVTRYIPVVDKTYTARWTTTTDTPQSYTVIYDANGGTGYMENQQFNYNEEKQLQPNSFVREYFTFAGWAKSLYSSSPDYTNCQIVSNLTSDDEITLYAVWTENGKVSPVIFTPTVKDVDYGDTVTLVSNTSGAEIHYTTNGSEPTVYSAMYESPIKITSDTTIKAIAVKSSMRESDVSTADYTIKNYTVTFSSEYSTAPAQITGLRKGDILTASKLPELSKTGYTFDGWYYSGTKINAGYEITCSIELTAKWNLETYTITYELNGGTNAAENPAGYSVETETITLKAATKNNYIFGGWYKEDSFATKVTEIAKGSTGNITLYAKWLKTYTITYELNGGTNATENPAGYSVETETITLKPAVKSGYIFDGWYKEDSFVTKVTEIAKGSTDNITLYAKWTDFVFVEGATIRGKIADSEVFTEERTVTISNFYICNHEVTQKEYSDVMGINSSYFNSDPADDEVQENRPVELVSWYYAVVYCNKRSLREGLKPCYTIKGSTDPVKWGTVPTSDSTWNVSCNFTANGYRLPTEVEWEWAARGGNGLKGTQYTYAGSDDIDEVAWHGSNSSKKTHEVKTKKANNLGLYDMSGNVWEWCWDWYSSIISSSTPATGEASGSYRCLRGGSWSSNDDDCRVAYRNLNFPFNSCSTPSYHSLGFGLRLVRSAQ